MKLQKLIANNKQSDNGYFQRRKLINIMYEKGFK